MSASHCPRADSAFPGGFSTASPGLGRRTTGPRQMPIIARDGCFPHVRPRVVGRHGLTAGEGGMLNTLVGV